MDSTRNFAEFPLQSTYETSCYSGSTISDNSSPNSLRCPKNDQNSDAQNFLTTGGRNNGILQKKLQMAESSENSSSSSEKASSRTLKAQRDPSSHRVIEKRRRDRMNNCLSNLSKLIPSAYLKKGHGRVEKTEIIEMAIRYMKHTENERRKLAKIGNSQYHGEFMIDKAINTIFEPAASPSSVNAPDSTRHCNLQCGDDTEEKFSKFPKTSNLSRISIERYKEGFFDCVAETVRFFIGIDGLILNEQIKDRMLNHLGDYYSEQMQGLCSSRMSFDSKLCGDILCQEICAQSNVQFYPFSEECPLNMSLKRQRRHLSTTAPSPTATTPSNQLRVILASKSAANSVPTAASSNQHQSTNGIQGAEFVANAPNATLKISANHGSDVESFVANQPTTDTFRVTVPNVPFSALLTRIGHLNDEAESTNQEREGSGLYEAQKSRGDERSDTSATAKSSGEMTISDGHFNSRMFIHSPNDSKPPKQPGLGYIQPCGSQCSSSTQYPSSPGSSFYAEGGSPLRASHSPFAPHSGIPVPIFALHPAGMFYVPLMVNSAFLDSNFNALFLQPNFGLGDPLLGEKSNGPIGATHPITINVDFKFSASSFSTNPRNASGRSSLDDEMSGVKKTGRLAADQ